MNQTTEVTPPSMRPFFIIWTGQALSMIGTRVAQFALVWWLTTLTGSATVLAIATSLIMLPQIVIGPIAGAYVDRSNRRKVMFIADTLAALIALLLAYLYWMDSIQVWHIYLLSFLRATGETFHWASMTASTSLMVPKKQLVRVSGLNQSMLGALGIIAPPLGALFYSLMPMHAIMGIDVITALFAIIPLIFISIPQPPSTQSDENKKEASLWINMKEGLNFIKGWPGLFMLTGIAILLNFVAQPVLALIPLLVSDHFQRDALSLGWLQSTLGGGVIIGGIILSVWGGFKKSVHTIFFGLVGMGIAILLLGLTPSNLFWLALVAMLLFGVMSPITNGSIFAILQISVPPEIQGRVFTLFTSLVTAMTPISLLIIGPIVDRTGLQAWYIFGGIMVIIISSISFFVPALQSIEQGPLQKQV